MCKFTNISVRKKISHKPNKDDFSMHIHSHYEILYFLGGDAQFFVEGTVYPLRKGDIVLMRSSETHKLHILSDADYTRMVMSFSVSNHDDPSTKRLMSIFNDRPLGKFNQYPSRLVSNPHLFHYIDEMCRTKEDYVRSSYLVAFLNELLLKFDSLKKLKYSYETNSSAKIIQYINDHIAEPISLQELSDLFFISKSQLNRNFKEAIGSTVWKYITDKRLLMAKKQIEYGSNPTKIYLDCGFNDYTSFYRAYRSKFGCPPSKTI